MPTIIPAPAETNALGMRRETSLIVDKHILRQTRVKMLSPVSRTSRDVEGFKTIIMICGAGLLVSLLLLTYDVDLSPGFF